MTEISRRKFIQLTVLGGAAAASGCDIPGQSRYDDRIYNAEVRGQYGGYDNRVYPYLNQPDGLQDGIPQYFATVCRMCPAGCGLFVRTMGGRAVKIEGNPAHPVSGGKTCARGQASLQQLYNPDRLRFPALRAARGQTPIQTDWEAAIGRLVAGIQAARGHGIALLADAATIGGSPTQSRLVGEFAARIGATVMAYSLLDDAPARAAAQAVYGRSQLPAYRLDEADFIVSFGGNFLEAWPSPVYYNRLFGEFRQGPRRKQGEHGRFVYVGPRMSMTAAKADTWLPCHPGTEAIVAQAISRELGGAGVTAAEAARMSSLPEEQIAALARGFRAAGTRAVAMGGDTLLGQADATALLTQIARLNAQTGSQCVGFGAAAIAAPILGGGGAGYRQIQRLIAVMDSGKVGALLILGQPNPVFTLPASAGFGAAIAKTPFVAALTPFEDETTAYADALLPIRTFLEDWGDAVPAVVPPGTRMATLQQPVIDPQYIGGPGLGEATAQHVPWMDTRPLGDLLIDIARHLGRPLADTDSRGAVRRMWARLGQADLTANGTDNDPTWVSALSLGGYWVTGAGGPATAAAGDGAAAPPALPPPGTFALHLYPHLYWTDGRHANLGWMQATPDPMTSAVWNSWVEINLQVAEQMGIRTGDIVRLSTPTGSLEAPAIPYPAIHPDVVAMPIGQGHAVYGRNAMHVGENPLAILEPTAETTTGALAFQATRVQLTKVRDALAGFHGRETLVLVQDRPSGQEPEAVQNLIHTTARAWKQAQPVYGAPQANESIFHRSGGEKSPGE